MSQPGDITLLLHQWSHGQAAVTEDLFELVYPIFAR